MTTRCGVTLQTLVTQTEYCGQGASETFRCSHLLLYRFSPVSEDFQIRFWFDETYEINSFPVVSANGICFIFRLISGEEGSKMI